MKLFWTNYHSHSHYCDGKYSPEAQVLGAIRQGVTSFGFSSHSPLPFDSDWNMKAERLPEYLGETKLLKEKYKDTIEIYTSLETDFLTGISGPGLYREMLDYTIGSVHFLHLPDGVTPWEIDGSSSSFLKHLTEDYHGDIRRVLEIYYHQFCRMASEDCPEITGHFDKIKIHNAHTPLWDESEKWYKTLVFQALEAIQASGCIIEVNTRGFYKKGISLYPSFFILEEMHRRKIPVVLNSDSHLPDEITQGFPYASGVLTEAGYKTVRILKKGQWTEAGLTPNGLIL
ncbi:MAG: histidinol-phosphatase [Bacteroidia bacterium]|nr:histidinol-phosphatase [Bacteroidia bacterium]